MFWTLSFVSFVLLVLLYVAYLFRERLVPLLPRKLQSYVRTYSELPTFDAAMEAGLHTGNFDLRSNLDDAREGLDAQGLSEVRRLMDRYSMSFDEARLRRQQDHFRRNGIDPATGLPLDKKAITSLG